VEQEIILKFGLADPIFLERKEERALLKRDRLVVGILGKMGFWNSFQC
jgi:hypothetical protein